MIKKATLTKFLVVVALLMTAILVQSIDLVKADPMPAGSPSVTIRSDGSIDPSTAPINKTGNLYTMTKDMINYTLTIQCNNITFDGTGHTLQGKGYLDGSTTIYSDAVGLTIQANNVIIKNTNIQGYYENCINVKDDWAVINGNNITDGGISLAGSFNNVTGNIITNGCVSLGGPYNMVRDNILIGSVVEIDSSGNSVYLNNFFNHTYYFWCDLPAAGNIFDNGSMGNYWDNYKGVDTNGDGVGDTPYVARVSASEYYSFNYPLMKPVNIARLLYPYPPTLTVLSPLNSTYNNGNVSLTFTASKPTSWLGYSLDGQANVTINGNCTLTELSNGLHNITIYANDTSDNVGRSETISFNVEKPEPVYFAVVVSAAAVSAVVVAVSIVYFKKRKH